MILLDALLHESFDFEKWVYPIETDVGLGDLRCVILKEERELIMSLIESLLFVAGALWFDNIIYHRI